MPFNYFVATLAFLFLIFMVLVNTSYKFAVLEFRKERLALSRDMLDHILTHEDDEDDDGPDLSDIFNRPAPDPSIIGKH